MTEVERIWDQMKRAFEGDAWHGPSVLEVLEGVSAEAASRRPIGAGHTIWELVLHMTTWKEVVIRRLGGESVTDVPPEVDFPKVRGKDAKAWVEAVDQLKETHARLHGMLSGISDEDLEEPPAPKLSTRYIQLHGIIQHDLYHAGQIMLLRRAQGQSR